MEIRDIAIAVFKKIVDEEIKFNVTLGEKESKILRTYDDSTGQRQCYLEHYGYGEPNPESYPMFFKVKRFLSFTNEGDKGKQDAVLFTFNLGSALEDESPFKLTKNSITIAGLTFVTYKNIL